MSVSANLNNPSLLICFKSIALVLFHLTHGYFGERVGSKGGGALQEPSLYRDIDKKA